MTPKQVARFWAKVDKSGECWLWQASRSAFGHGRFGIGKHNSYAHRVAWELTYGPIPLGMNVCHNCPGGDNPACVNPAHLFLGTKRDNMRDAAHKGRLSRGEGSHLSKLTDARVRWLRDRYAAGGVSYSQLAAELGLTQTPVYNAINRITWKHIP